MGRKQTRYLREPDKWEVDEAAGYDVIYEGTEVVERIPKRMKRKKTDKTIRKYVDKILPDGTLVKVESNVDPDSFKTKHHLEKKSDSLISDVCNKIANGMTISDICAMGGVYPTLNTWHRWMRDDPTHKQMYEDAKQWRATHFHDKALGTALAVSHKDDVPAAKLQVDTLKWAASVGSPKEYGQAAEKQAIMPVQINFVSSIDAAIMELDGKIVNVDAKDCDDEPDSND